MKSVKRKNAEDMPGPHSTTYENFTLNRFLIFI